MSTATTRPNGSREATNVRALRRPEDRLRTDDASPAAALAELEPDRDALYALVRDELAGPDLHDEAIQSELGRWVHLLETTEVELKDGPNPRGALRRLVRAAGAAIPALLSPKPDLVFARTLRLQAEIGLLRHNGWLTRNLIRLTGGSPVLTVCLGAFGAALLGLGVHFLWHWGQQFAAISALIPFDPGHVSAVTGAAFLGGLVSILSRLPAFSRLGDFEHVFLSFNALFKPFIGVIFGLFAYAFWHSGLLPLERELVENVTVHQLWVVGFLAGFSERFTKDLISRGEGLLSTSRKS